MLDTTTDPPNPDPRGESSSIPRLIRPRAEARASGQPDQDRPRDQIPTDRLHRRSRSGSAEKQEWVVRSTDLLKHLFSDGSIADQCNDWVGQILPEYAEFDMFVEQFANEMRHRIGRLQSLGKRLDEFPESASAPGVSAPLTAAPCAVSPPIVQPMIAVPTIRWSGLLISHAADETMEKSVGEFLARLDVSVDTVDCATSNGKPAHDLVEFALILKGSSPAEGDDLFELGFCVGRFGVQRVCVLHRDAAPGAQHGVCHIPLDSAGTGSFRWRDISKPAARRSI